MPEDSPSYLTLRTAAMTALLSGVGLKVRSLFKSQKPLDTWVKTATTGSLHSFLWRRAVLYTDPGKMTYKKPLLKSLSTATRNKILGPLLHPPSSLLSKRASSLSLQLILESLNASASTLDTLFNRYRCRFRAIACFARWWRLQGEMRRL